MGFLRGLFGRSRDREAGKDRCMECGMTGGSHTDWCPTDVDAAAAPPPPSEPSAEPEAEQPTA